MLQVGLGGHVALPAVRARLHTKQVGPEMKHVLGVAFAGEKLVDQLCALFLISAPQERLSLLQRRYAADDVEMSATDEGFIAGGRIRRELVQLPVLGEEGVDLFRRLVRLGRDDEAEGDEKRARECFHDCAGKRLGGRPSIPLT
jgi:hypothetical protein